MIAFVPPMGIGLMLPQQDRLNLATCDVIEVSNLPATFLPSERPPGSLDFDWTKEGKPQRALFYENKLSRV